MENLTTIKALVESGKLEIIGDGTFRSCDNNEMHDILNNRCNAFTEISDQDTWVFSDGTYITRNGDDYFTGDDVDEFESVSEM